MATREKFTERFAEYAFDDTLGAKFNHTDVPEK